MYLIRLRITGRCGPVPTEADAHALHDLIRAHSRSDEGLEYLRSRVGIGCVDLVLFVHVPGGVDPERYCRELCAAAVSASPEFRRWHVEIAD